jgi:AAA ATPase domain
MKIQVKNLGPLKEAEFEVADLTIICGGNNTGKTYATYALFGFLHTWREMVSIEIAPSVIKCLKNDNTVSIDIGEYVNSCQQIVNKACKKYIERLPRIFAASSEYFSNADFKVLIDNDFTHLRSSRYSYRIESNRILKELLAIKEEDNLVMNITIMPTGDFPDHFFSRWVVDIIQDFLFSEIIYDVFIASVERTGISIFKRKIDDDAILLLQKISRENTPNSKIDLFMDRYKNYPLPIQFGLDFNRLIEDENSEAGFISKNHPSILEDFADIIGGEYNFNNHGKLHYSPKINPGIRLSIYESSSAVRSLLDIGFYLRQIAVPGSLLIIDEPELNLHPENQRRIARLIARLVNIGIKVLITTHSDYIIKELNTLIMLNHDKPHLKKIAEEEGYKPEELIAAERIKVYIAENSTLVPANIDPEMGIEARSFDTTIEDMNRIQEAIVWGEE